MTDIPSRFAGELPLVITILLVILAIVIAYLILLGRAIIEMLRHNVHGVLITFAFVALIPLPPVLVMGIMVLIIWHHHKKDILAGRRQET